MTSPRGGLLPALAKPPSLGAGSADGLLAALTLAPATWSRNRFFDLYQDPGVRSVRRRAGLLRGVVRHLARAGVEGLSETQDGDSWVLAYRIRDLGLSRTVVLSAFENAVLRVTLARAKGEPPLDPWKAVVDRALAQLEQRKRLGSASTSVVTSAPNQNALAVRRRRRLLTPSRPQKPCTRWAPLYSRKPFDLYQDAFVATEIEVRGRFLEHRTGLHPSRDSGNRGEGASPRNEDRRPPEAG